MGRNDDVHLTRARAEQIVAAIVGWNPKAADELADLLLSLERRLAGRGDDAVESLIETIDLLVEMAFQESQAYCQYLDVYRETVGQRCGPASCAFAGAKGGEDPGPGHLREDSEQQVLNFMVVRSGRRRSVH